MSLLELTVQPRGDETHHVMPVQLDGQRYTLDVYTNTADGRWYLDYEGEGGSVVRGLALAAGVDLLHPYRHLDSVPAGYLFVATDDGADPDLSSFLEGRAKLYYLEAST